MVITGYRINSTDLGTVMKELAKPAAQVKKLSTKEYHRLLAEKAVFLSDCIALNMCERVQGRALIDDAVTQLGDEINIAMRTGVRSDLNFQVYVHLAPYEGSTYIRLTCPNKTLLKAFKGLENFSLSDEESQNRENRKTKTWLAIYEDSKKNEPASINLTYIPEPDVSRLKYPAVRERAEKMARHNLLNQYMNLLAGGRQIPPVYMMEYVDRAMEMLLADDGQKELAAKIMQLEQMLPDINADPGLVLTPYGESRAPATWQQEPQAETEAGDEQE